MWDLKAKQQSQFTLPLPPTFSLPNFPTPFILSSFSADGIAYFIKNREAIEMNSHVSTKSMNQPIFSQTHRLSFILLKQVNSLCLQLMPNPPLVQQSPSTHIYLRTQFLKILPVLYVINFYPLIFINHAGKAFHLKINNKPPPTFPPTKASSLLPLTNKLL